MRFINLLVLVLFFNSSVFAETFTEALKKTFDNNAELNAERENINVSEQELNVSRGNYLPTITLSGSKSQEETNKLTNQSGGNASINDVNPKTQSITITQTLIDFGRQADFDKSKIGISLAKAKLLKKEYLI